MEYDDGWRSCDRCRKGFTWYDDEPYPCYNDLLLCQDCRPDTPTDGEVEIAELKSQAHKQGQKE